MARADAMIVKRVDGGKRYSVLIGYRLIEMSKAMIETTTNSSIKVKAPRLPRP